MGRRGQRSGTGPAATWTARADRRALPGTTRSTSAGAARENRASTITVSGWETSSVDIDRGGKIVVSFMPERGRGSDRERRPVLFTGTVAGPRLRADMVTEDRRLHGAMTLSVDDRQNVNSIAMEATDGRDRLHLTWDRR